MQNKRKVWWKWLLYPLTIIIGILLLLISPILFLIALGIDCDFMIGDLLLHLFYLPFERKEKKWLRKTILKIILIINSNIIKKRKIFIIKKETN